MFKKAKEFFSDIPFWRELFAICIPITIQGLISTSFSIVDTLMVSTLGDNALSGLTISSQWVSLANALIHSLVSGMSIFAAQFFGNKDMEGVKKSFGIAVTLACFILTPFLLGAIVLPGKIVSIYTKDPEVATLAIDYLKIVCFAFPATVLGGLFSSLLRSTGHVKIPTFSSICSMFVNVIGNYCLIGGHFGCPALGVKGAAIATLLAAWSDPIISYLVSLSVGTILISPVKSFFTYTFSDIKVFLKKCFPLIVNLGSYSLANTILVAIYSNMGSENTAAISIMSNVTSLTWAAHGALANAINIMVGHRVGAGKIFEAKRNANRIIVFDSIMCLMISGVFIFFSRPLVSLYNSAGTIDPETLKLAESLVFFFAARLVTANVPSSIMDGIFRAGGNTTPSAIMDGVAMWGIAIPTAFITSRFLPFFWVYVITRVFEEVPKGIAVVIFYFTDRWFKPVTEAGKLGLEEYLEAKRAKQTR